MDGAVGRVRRLQTMRTRRVTRTRDGSPRRVHEESHGAALHCWILLVCEENVRHEILFHSTHATTPLHRVFRPSCAPRRPVFFRVPRRRCFFLSFFFFARWQPLRMMGVCLGSAVFRCYLIHPSVPSFLRSRSFFDISLDVSLDFVTFINNDTFLIRNKFSTTNLRENVSLFYQICQT